MNRWAVFFLILLRLAIGWHFLIEGYQKIPAKYLAELRLPTSGKSFSSAGYFREAPGPLGDVVRRFEGDLDDEALARLVARPVPQGEDPATFKVHDRVPPGLHQDWSDYLQRFSVFHGLDEAQKKRAEAILEQYEARVVGWLSYVPPTDTAVRDKDPNYQENTTEQTRVYPSGSFERRMSMAERVAEYRNKVNELRDIQGRKLWTFGKDVEGGHLRTLKTEAVSIRQGLLGDLDKQTKAYQEALDKLLTNTQKAEGTVPLAEPRGMIAWIDRITPWALTGIGACLLLGLYSRLAAFLAAGFLLMTYLAMPSWPWVPVPPASEGNYLFVNKNVVEMLALFVLASIPTGRWFGLDAILFAFKRLIWGKKSA